MMNQNDEYCVYNINKINFIANLAFPSLHNVKCYPSPVNNGSRKIMKLVVRVLQH